MADVGHIVRCGRLGVVDGWTSHSPPVLCLRRHPACAPARVRALQALAEAALATINSSNGVHSECSGDPPTQHIGGSDDEVAAALEFLSKRESFGGACENVRSCEAPPLSNGAASAAQPASELEEVDKAIMELHAEAVRRVVSKLPSTEKVDLVAMHGQTLCHYPPSRAMHSDEGQRQGVPPFTWQLGDGARLARLLREDGMAPGTPVVFRFRDNDVSQGGEGAPLAPAYHNALVCSSIERLASLVRAERCHGKGHGGTGGGGDVGSAGADCITDGPDAELVVGVLNIGGVSNLTVLAAVAAADGAALGEASDDREIIAFDVGPGNALLDDFMLRRTGVPCDVDGAGLRGAADRARVESIMMGLSADEFNAAERKSERESAAAVSTGLAGFLRRRAPKSCDRDQFARSITGYFDESDGSGGCANISTDDGAATLTLLTAACVKDAVARLPAWTRGRLGNRLDVVVVCGGGRRNPAMMRSLKEELGCGVIVLSSDADVFQGSWRGDAIEAEAFAYLGVRSRMGLPLSWPQTTGVPAPTTGGVSVAV